MLTDSAMQHSVFSCNPNQTPPPKPVQNHGQSHTLTPAEAYRLVHIALIEATLGNPNKMRHITEKLDTILKHQQFSTTGQQDKSTPWCK